MPALWWREKLQVIKCFFGLNRKRTHGTAETQTIVQKIHRDYVIRFKALESTAALFCTFDQSFQKNVVTITAFLYIYCVYINTSKELQNSKLSAVSASVTVVLWALLLAGRKDDDRSSGCVYSHSHCMAAPHQQPYLHFYTGS